MGGGGGGKPGDKGTESNIREVGGFDFRTSEHMTFWSSCHEHN